MAEPASALTSLAIAAIGLVVTLAGIGIGLIVWLVRLEARSLANQEAIAAERRDRAEQVENLERRLLTQRAEDNENRRREWEALHGVLKTMREEMGQRIDDLRDDIRTFLRRVLPPGE
jgi:uncharacterized protein HemX